MLQRPPLNVVFSAPGSMTLEPGIYMPNLNDFIQGIDHFYLLQGTNVSIGGDPTATPPTTKVLNVAGDTFGAGFADSVIAPWRLDCTKPFCVRSGYPTFQGVLAGGAVQMNYSHYPGETLSGATGIPLTYYTRVNVGGGNYIFQLGLPTWCKWQIVAQDSGPNTFQTSGEGNYISWEFAPAAGNVDINAYCEVIF